jgi:hypothetical protein
MDSCVSSEAVRIHWRKWPWWYQATHLVVMVVTRENSLSLSDGDRIDILVGCCCGVPSFFGRVWCLIAGEGTGASRLSLQIATRLSNSN